MEIKKPVPRHPDCLSQVLFLNVHMECIQQEAYIITADFIQQPDSLLDRIEEIRLKPVQGFQRQPDSL